jgi:tRNA pseudouridine synthase 10
MYAIKIRNLILKQGEICDHCLGRQVWLNYRGKHKGIVPTKIGAAMRSAKTDKDIDKNLKKNLKVKETKKCFVCHGLFYEVPKMTKLVLDTAKKYEFNSFLVGSRFSKDIQFREEELWTKIGIKDVEPIKREVNTLIGMKVEKRTGKKAEFKYPDVVFLADFDTGKVKTQLNSLYLYGRYQKLIRGIPQTKWPCSECGGRGCKSCSFTGKQYKDSVEDLIAPYVIKTFKARDESFHGEGREDIDALMLGSGRPFVFEVKEPVVRNADLKKLEKSINKAAKGKIKITGLRHSNLLEMRQIKAHSHDKSYEAIIECKRVTKKDLEKLEKFFKNKVINQKTPQRVLHRRADLLRKRKIKKLRCTPLGKGKFKAELLTEAGTYIKELVSGDKERTKPSFSSVIKKPCVVKELDVTGIEDA